MRAFNIYLTALIFLSSWNGFSQRDNSTINNPVDSSVILLDSIIELTKSNAYNSSNVNWEKLSDEMFEISTKFDSIEKIGKPAEHMFKTLGDFHGMLMYDYKVAYSYKPDNGGVPKDSLWSAITAAKIKLPYEIEARMIDNNIAYLEIVGTGVMQKKDIILARDYIRETICSLKRNQPDGWIIDLRCDTGGNMHPMMAGIGQLIPNADLGGDTKDGETFFNKWSLKNGNFLENGYANYPEPLKCEELQNEQRIAVLISRYTASSGEVVASSLKGQNNIKLIGEKTAGLSSTNGWHVLSDKWVLAPMIGYFMSKDKTVHNNGVVPDIEVKEDLNLENLFEGIMIERALDWIKLGE